MSWTPETVTHLFCDSSIYQTWARWTSVMSHTFRLLGILCWRIEQKFKERGQHSIETLTCACPWNSHSLPSSFHWPPTLFYWVPFPSPSFSMERTVKVMCRGLHFSLFINSLYLAFFIFVACFALLSVDVFFYLEAGLTRCSKGCPIILPVFPIISGHQPLSSSIRTFRSLSFVFGFIHILLSELTIPKMISASGEGVVNCLKH